MADFDQLASAFGGIATSQPTDAAPPAPAAADGTKPDFDALASQHGGVAAMPEPGQPTAPQADPDRPSDLGGAALSGLKQTLAPFALSKEELDKPKTGAETAVEVGTNLASDVALGAGIGMLVGPEGALLGAGAGALVHVAMAAYRGFGYEYAKSKAEGQGFDPVRGLVNTAAQINPLVGKGGRLIKGATQAILEYASQYQYSHDEGSSAVAGGIGAVIAGLTHRQTGEWLAHIGTQVSRPGSTTERAGVQPSEMEAMITLASDDSKYGIGARTEALIKDAQESDPDFFKLGVRVYESQLDGAPAELTSDVRQFKRWLMDQPGATKDDADTAARTYARQFGEDKLADAYTLFKRQQLQNQAVERLRMDLEQDILGFDKDGNVVDGSKAVTRGRAIEDPVGGLADKLRDIKFVMRKIDSSVGLNFEGAVDNFSAAKNKASNIAGMYVVWANELTTQARKLGMDQEDLGRWLAEADINKGRTMNTNMGVTDVGKQTIKWASKEEQDVAEGWRRWFESARLRLKNEGMNVDFLNAGDFQAGDRYLPMRAKTGPQAAAAMRGEVQQLQQRYGNDYLTKMDSSDLRRATARMLNAINGTDLEPEAIKYQGQVNDAIAATLKPEAKSAIGYAGGMHFQREIGLPAPEFLRDFDVGKLAVGYINNGLKATIYHDPMMQLNASLETLRGMGFDRSADYLSKYLGDISGQPSNFASTITANVNKYKDIVNRLIEDQGTGVGATLKTSALKAARDMPDFVSFAVSSIYPNFLGWNIRAAARDFAKPFLLTAPELGWGYGMKVVSRAMMSAAWQKLKGASIEEELLQRDLLPAKHFGVLGDLADSGVRSIKGVGRAVEALEWTNEKSMWMYSQTDKFNRYLQLQVGHELAKDLKAGDPRALAYVQRTLSEGNKSSLRALGTNLKDIDTKQLGDELGSQLVAKTSFNYGKEGMNDFGRSMGRVFSMFTKWPAMMMSDAAEHFQNEGFVGGAVKNAQRYIAPMAAMMLASQYLLDTENNPTQRFLIGKNLAEWAPAQSWKIGTPPLLQSAQDFGTTFMHMLDSDKDHEQKLGLMSKFAQRNILTFMPGMGAYNEYQRYDRAFNPEDYNARN